MLYQGAASCELLSAGGTAPAVRFKAKLSAGVKRAYDAEVKGYVWTIDGGGSTRLTLGATQSLGVVHRFVVLQLKVAAAKTFALELVVADAQRHRRRVLLSSAFTSESRTPLHAQIPIASAIDESRNVWLDWRIDVPKLAQLAFGGVETASYTLESIAIGPSCRLRGLYTLKDESSTVIRAQAMPACVDSLVSTFPPQSADDGAAHEAPPAPPAQRGGDFGIVGRAVAANPRPPANTGKHVRIAFGQRCDDATSDTPPKSRTPPQARKNARPVEDAPARGAGTSPAKMGSTSTSPAPVRQSPRKVQSPGPVPQAAKKVTTATAAAGAEAA